MIIVPHQMESPPVIRTNDYRTLFHYETSDGFTLTYIYHKNIINISYEKDVLEIKYIDINGNVKFTKYDLKNHLSIRNNHNTKKEINRRNVEEEMIELLKQL